MNLKLMTLVGAALLSSAAFAQTIFGVNNLAAGNINTLTQFQANNPAGWTTIGQMTPGNTQLFTGLDFAGVGGQLFAWSSTGGLHSVNLQSGLATRIGGNTANIQDLSWNPVTGQMVGLQSSSGSINLVDINLQTGATTLLGAVTGIANALAVGLGHDAQGRAFIHDIVGDRLHRIENFTSVSSIVLPKDTNFSQGMVIDWSGNGRAYMAAIGNVPGFFSELWEVDLDNNSVNILGNFGTGLGQFPTFEGGDLAINPVPEPATMTALGLGALALLRRRKKA